ncbi:MAG: glycosyltransferase [Coxiellaceae bacterium]|nr:glycosyltransferase [Coxiellaceae bacterium]
MNVLWMVSGFPKNTNSPSCMYYWHAFEALEKLGCTQIILEIAAWKPFLEKKNTAHSEKIMYFGKYLSIPRFYWRGVSNLFCLLQNYFLFKKIIGKHPIDVIHAHGEICGFVANFLGKKFNIPVVLTLHGIETTARMWQGLSRKQFLKTLNAVDRLIFVGEPLQRYFHGLLMRQEHCRILHNGVRLPEERCDNKQASTFPIRIISVSLLVEGKGIDLNLRALAKLKKMGIENWVYIIAGDGIKRETYQKMAVMLDISEQIKWLGACSHDEVYAHLSTADVFCLPSYREAFGIAYLEAMAHGLITIGVKHQGPAAFISHEKTGFLVNPEDVDDLANTLQAVMQKYDDMQAIREAARKHAFSSFSWEVYAKKLVNIYEEMDECNARKISNAY